MEGLIFNHRVIFPLFVCPLRTMESFNNQMDKDHHRGISSLLSINIDCVTQIPLDPMHLLYLGIMKKLLYYWIINGKQPYKLSSRDV